jgi:hypothetical protein
MTSNPRIIVNSRSFPQLPVLKRKLEDLFPESVFNHDGCENRLNNLEQLFEEKSHLTNPTYDCQKHLKSMTPITYLTRASSGPFVNENAPQADLLKKSFLRYFWTPMNQSTLMILNSSNPQPLDYHANISCNVENAVFHMGKLR